MSAPAPRMEYQAFAKTPAYAALAALSRSVVDGGLEKPLIELVKVRASQMNGCAFCLKFHVDMARKLEVAPEKLDLVAAWRDAGVFTPREMAALAWTEAMTYLDHADLDDAAYGALLKEFSETEAMHLTVSIATINQWNRIGVALRFPPPMPSAA